MKKPDSNGEPIKKTRAAKKFEEKFDALRRQFHAAEDSQIDAIFAEMVECLTSSRKECVNFLRTCVDEQFRAVLLVLDDVALEFADLEFLDVLKETQKRFPKYDLTASMDAAAYAVAEREAEIALRKAGGAARAKAIDALYARAEKGEPEAQYHLALRLYFGLDLDQDYDAARRWAQKALDAGYVPASIFRDLPRP